MRTKLVYFTNFNQKKLKYIAAAVSELVDEHGLGPCTERCGGSIPLCGTKFAKLIYVLCNFISTSFSKTKLHF